MITLRRVLPEDSEKLRIWRNLPEIRKYFFNSDKVSFETHTQWFSNAIKNPLINIFIASINTQEVGVLRFDQEMNRAIVSIYVLPEFWGKGLGTKILLKGESFLKETPVSILEAKVFLSNTASQKIFLKAGYKEYSKNEQYCILTKKI